LKNAVIELIKDVLLPEEKNLNRRFRTYHEKKRPYVILKWAQSADYFMDIDRASGGMGSFAISCEESRTLVHKWRSQEDAIMVGKNTVLIDDPELTTRLVQGKSPLRITLDKHMSIPEKRKLLCDGHPTLIYTSLESGKKGALEYHHLTFKEDVFPDVLNDLYRREIQSILVEGGRSLIDSILKTGLWDEARVFTSKNELQGGLKAPTMPLEPTASELVGTDKLDFYRRNQ